MKGIEYLEKARHLDRIDIAIPNLLIPAKLEFANQQLTKCKFDRVRQIMDQCEDLLVDNQHNYTCSRWSFSIRRALIEIKLGDLDKAKAALDLAHKQAPSPACVSFLACLLDPNQGSVPAVFDKTEWMTLLAKSFSAQQAFDLLNIYGALSESSVFYSRAKDMFGTLLKLIEKNIHEFHIRQDRMHLMDFLHKISFSRPLREKLVKMGLKTDPSDPFFQLNEYLLDDRSIEPFDIVLGRLQKMLAEAKKRQDDKTANLIQSEIQAIPAPFACKDGEPSIEDGFPVNPTDFDEEEEDDDDSGEEEGNFSINDLFPADLVNAPYEEIKAAYDKLNGFLPKPLKIAASGGVKKGCDACHYHDDRTVYRLFRR